MAANKSMILLVAMILGVMPVVAQPFDSLRQAPNKKRLRLLDRNPGIPFCLRQAGG